MLKSVFLIVGRIIIILAVAGIVIGLVAGLSSVINFNPRFGREGDRERFAQGQQPDGVTGQPGQPPQQPRGEDEEGFRGGGSLVRGLMDVAMNAAGIAIFTLAGWFLFRRYRRRLPETS
jgi:hypothetical protein